MKSSFYKQLLLSLIAAHAFAENNPLPPFIPTQPPPEKPITEYTVGDVLACNSVYDLPANHNYYADKRYNAGLKENWPGAKISTNIDALCQIVLNAPEVDPPFQHLYDLKKATNNLHVVIRAVMDVSENEKVEALLRIVAAQTDPKKKKWAVDFASDFFIDVLDPRLLNLEKERLDDTSIARRIVAEGIPDIEVTARSEAKSRILRWLQDDLAITLDESPFDVPDEAEACAALKAWLDVNAAMIATKCVELKAKPDRKIPTYSKRTWDAR